MPASVESLSQGMYSGGGYGRKLSCWKHSVLINTKLRIHDPNMPDGNNFDLSVTEELASTTDGDAPPARHL